MTVHGALVVLDDEKIRRAVADATRCVQLSQFSLSSTHVRKKVMSLWKMKGLKLVQKLSAVTFACCSLVAASASEAAAAAALFSLQYVDTASVRVCLLVNGMFTAARDRNKVSLKEG